MPDKAERCYLQIAVVNKDAGRALIEVAQRFGCPGHIRIPARGTAHSELLDALGLESHSKEVILSFVREGQAERELDALRGALQLDREGRGIAFHCPIGLRLGLKSLFALFAEGEGEARPESAGERAPAPAAVPAAAPADGAIVSDSHRLLLFVVPQGHADALMVHARAAGAVGGTILHGKGFGLHDAASLFGLPIDPEKEILMILVRKSISAALVEAVVAKGRLSEPGRGICLALPVARVAGLKRPLAEADEYGNVFA